jgi:hypothetical protein
MELNGWSSPRCSRGTAGAPATREHAVTMTPSRETDVPVHGAACGGEGSR